MKILITMLCALVLSGCGMLESFQESHKLLSEVNKGDAQMQAGLAEQTAGAALVTKGKITYQEGKVKRDTALTELNEKYQ